MPPLPRRSLQTLLMSFSNPLPAFQSLAGATLPFAPRRLLHLRRLPSKSLFFAVEPSGARSPGLILPSRSVHLARQDDEIPLVERVGVLKSKLEQRGIRCPSHSGQYSNMLCPKCKGGASMEKSFSLFIREDWGLCMWSCFRGQCGWNGSVEATRKGKDNEVIHKKTSKRKGHRVLTEEELHLEPLSEELLSYFAARKISVETLQRNAVMQITSHGQIAIAFTYRREGTLVGCKYRDTSKKFWQEKDTQRIFYGLDDIKLATDVIIVEGEMDKLAMEEAGYLNCVSVPDGAPSQVSRAVPSQEEDTKFQYLWSGKQYLDKASRIILATDADLPGKALAEELARRIGKEKCWRVMWPMKNADEVCKDANEVLMYLGPDALKEAIENAEMFPIRGLYNFKDFFSEIDAYYHGDCDDELGVSTGWCNVDDFYKVIPGELTVVTGVPNSGKSEWIDALLCNINRHQGWKFVLCSMENKVREHARKLLEKYIKKPFLKARYTEYVEPMSSVELEEGKKWLNDTFHLIRCDDDCLPSVQFVLTLAKAAVCRHGVRGLVIDPYNELDHQRPTSQTETEYVSHMLSKIKSFARHHGCHVWFVAHPRQLQNWGGGPPNLYDISGSAHFINKCDNGIVIHRNRDANAGPLDLVQVCVRKVRNKVAGCMGEAFLSYDQISGEYTPAEAPKSS